MTWLVFQTDMLFLKRVGALRRAFVVRGGVLCPWSGRATRRALVLVLLKKKNAWLPIYGS